MTAAASDHSTAPPEGATTHPRTRSMESWRARKAVMASRGEVDGPRIAECDSALSWWRTRAFLIREMSLTEARADSLLDLIDQHAEAERAADAEPAEPAVVAR